MSNCEAVVFVPLFDAVLKPVAFAAADVEFELVPLPNAKRFD